MAVLSEAAQAVRTASIARHIANTGRPNRAGASFDGQIATAVATAERDGVRTKVNLFFKGYKWKSGRKSWRTSSMTEQLLALPSGEVVTENELREAAEAEAAAIKAEEERIRAAAVAAEAEKARLEAEAVAAARAAQADLTAAAQHEATRALEAARLASAKALEARGKVAELPVPIVLDGSPVPPYTDEMIAAAEANQLPIPPFNPVWAQQHNTSMVAAMPSAASARWPRSGYTENKRRRDRWFKYREILASQIGSLSETYRLALETLRMSMGGMDATLWLSAFCSAARSWYIDGGGRRTLFNEQGGKAVRAWIDWMGWARIPGMIDRGLEGRARHEADLAKARAVVGTVTQVALAIVGSALLTKLVTAGMPAAEAEAAVTEEVAAQAAGQALSPEEKDALAQLSHDDAMDSRHLQNVSLTGPSALITRFWNWFWRAS